MNSYFASPSDGETLAGLRRRLGLAAEAEGLLDVAYTTIDSPVGPLLLDAAARELGEYFSGRRRVFGRPRRQADAAQPGGFRRGRPVRCR
jgi:hypothetical protein